MPAEGTLRLQGQAQLIKAFTRAGKNEGRYIREELKKVAEPVAHEAEELSKSQIRRIGTKWWKMRVGVTQKLVYVVPAQSGGRGPASRRRPNFAPLMQGRALDPALKHNQAFIAIGVNRALERIETEWGI